jgi:hypothetical protein
LPSWPDFFKTLRMKTKTSPTTNSMNRSPLRRGFLLILLVLACIALVPRAQAVDPPPDGGYPHFNTAEGEDALFSLNGGRANTALGYHALHLNVYAGWNTAVGASALESNAGGYYNTAVGEHALSSNIDALNNTAVGYSALASENCFFCTDNVAIGYRAMANANSFACVAIGSEALVENTGQLNTAIGERSMENNTSGSSNTAVGWASMNWNTTGLNNAAVGSAALGSNTTGNFNSVMGVNGANYNTTGSNLASFGYHALYNNTTGNTNTAVGSLALFMNATGSGNIALGSEAGEDLTTGDNNIAIGNVGVAGDSGIIRIGTVGVHTTVYIAGIKDTPLTHGSAVAVGITPDGQLGVRASSARYKEAIKPMDTASEAILALKPVTFRYKHEFDPAGIPQFGLVAEDVEKVNPDLVARDKDGKPYTVRYEAVNAMLLNEFLKEHRKVEEQGAMIAKQQKQIEALTAGLQKVSVRFEPGRRAQETVVSNP